jgi:hypothetical protein
MKLEIVKRFNAGSDRFYYCLYRDEVSIWAYPTLDAAEAAFERYKHPVSDEVLRCEIIETTQGLNNEELNNCLN